MQIRVGRDGGGPRAGVATEAVLPEAQQRGSTARHSSEAAQRGTAARQHSGSGARSSDPRSRLCGGLWAGKCMYGMAIRRDSRGVPAVQRRGTSALVCGAVLVISQYGTKYGRSHPKVTVRSRRRVKSIGTRIAVPDPVI